MRKWTMIMVICIGIACLGSCTNDEGGSDIDVLTPNDTTQSAIPESGA